MAAPLATLLTLEMQTTIPKIVLCIILMICVCATLASASDPSPHPSFGEMSSRSNVDSLTYVDFPKRSSASAAVLEWGHSASISAIDGVAATFGSQPSSGSLFEVEAKVVLARPIDGSTALTNCDEARGNILVMTANAEAAQNFVGVARRATACGAAALVVVLVDNDTDSSSSSSSSSSSAAELSPDYIFSMNSDQGDDATDIDIPVVMISLTSGNLLAAGGGQHPSEVEEEEEEGGGGETGGGGLPPRARLYGSGDRPFFEDVSSSRPAVYLIHNLLSGERGGECDYLRGRGAPTKSRGVRTYGGEATLLEGSEATRKGGIQVDRTFLWDGVFEDHVMKNINERIEQVTGFPRSHFSDFQINMYPKGGFHSLHYDVLETSVRHSQTASILIFLNDVPPGAGGELIFSAANPPIKIHPRKGLAVVWHNTVPEYVDPLNSDELSPMSDPYSPQFNPLLDDFALHGELRSTADVKWTAKKFIYATPRSLVRRAVLPALFHAVGGGGRAPTTVIGLHGTFTDKWGVDKGDALFDWAIGGILLAVFILCWLSLCVGVAVWRRLGGRGGAADEKVGASATASKKKAE